MQPMPVATWCAIRGLQQRIPDDRNQQSGVLLSSSR